MITTKQGHVGKPEIRIGQKFGLQPLSNEVGDAYDSSPTQP